MTSTRHPFLSFVFRDTKHAQRLQESMGTGMFQLLAPAATALGFSALKNSYFNIIS